MITITYNDDAIREYLDNNVTISSDKKLEDLTDFIHVNSEHGQMLYKMVIKSCDILRKHYLLIQKTDLKEKSEEDIKKDLEMLKEKLRLQKIIENKTTGVRVKLSDNGGLFTDKIILLFNETLGMFCLADNIYFEQIKSISKRDLIEYYYFCSKINEKNFFENIDKHQGRQLFEVLYNLKSSIENKLNDLFTSSYQGDNININNHIYKYICIFSDMIKEVFVSLGNREEGKINNIKNETEEQKNTRVQNEINDYKSCQNEYLNEEEDDEDNFKKFKLYKFLIKLEYKIVKNYSFITSKCFKAKKKILLIV